MLDWPAHLRETAAHLILMSNTPGWDEHARKRRDELLAMPMYAAPLKAELLRQMREAKERGSS